MKKPKKTLKDLGRIENLLSKQTARSAKLLAHRKTGEDENPVTAGYYARIAAQHAAALADLSEIVHLTESLTRQSVEAEAAKAARKKAKGVAKSADGAKDSNSAPRTSRKSAAKASARAASDHKAPASKAPARKPVAVKASAPARRRSPGKPAA